MNRSSSDDIRDKLYPIGKGNPPSRSWWAEVKPENFAEVAKVEALRMTTAKSSYSAPPAGTP